MHQSNFGTKLVLDWLLFVTVAITLGSCASGGGQQGQEGGLENYEYEGEGEMTTADNFSNGGNYGSNYGGGNEYSGGNAYGGGNEYGGNEYGGDNYAAAEGNEYGGDDYAAYGGNNLTANNSVGEYNYGGNAMGEAVNNAVDDELFSNEALTNDSLSGQALNNAVDTELVADSQLVNGAAYEGNSAPLAGQSANALPEYQAAPAAGPSTPPPAGGIVKYVLGEVSMLDQPGGTPVKSLRRGDHPVVYDMGEYHQTMSGYVIPSTSLSTEATGRSRESGYWR